MTTCSVPEPTDAGEQPPDRQREVTETDKERETRLALRRARYRARRAARSLPARETHLQQIRFAAWHRRQNRLQIGRAAMLMPTILHS